MIRFAIITPTIGRETLKRCLLTMKHQVHKHFVHIVVGDGPQDSWVRDECEKYNESISPSSECFYIQTDVKEGVYGANPRNFALQNLENGKFGTYEYVLFLDDDNILLEPTLYNANNTILLNNRPPLLWQDILFTNKYKTEYFILPKGGSPLVNGDWDGLNGIYRADILKGLRHQPVYTQDLTIGLEAAARANNQWVKVNGIGGVHCLSWDTY